MVIQNEGLQSMQYMPQVMNDSFHRCNLAGKSLKDLTINETIDLISFLFLVVLLPLLADASRQNSTIATKLEACIVNASSQ